MDTDKKGIFSSVIGRRLQTEFVKLFSGDIETSEFVRNEPKMDKDPEPSERFLDRN